MPDTIPVPLALERDGTGQADRRLPGLDPDSVRLDERGLGDWLAFAHEFAQELRFYGLDNQPNGDWRGFLNPANLTDPQALAAHWREMEAFLADPERFDESSPHHRPHLALFLAFLNLLRLSQQRMNQLTRRHLDFYFQTVLALDKQPAQPDRVNILATPTADQAEAMLPRGSLLYAGKDSASEDLLYRTDEDLLVNRARIGRLYSVFVDKRITGLREAREACVETRADPVLAMFALVYGEPAAGDPLPPYPPGQAVDGAFLTQLRGLLDFVSAGLRMSFQDFRSLMRLKIRRAEQSGTDWRFINGTLEIIGKANTGEGFSIPPDSQDFDANLTRALGGKLPDFASLPGDIRGLEDLYANVERSAVVDFIRDGLHLTAEQFTAMMSRKIAVDNDWRVINALLEAAAQRRLKNPDFRLVPDQPASPEFAQNLQTALGKLDFSAFTKTFQAGDLDSFHVALQRAEAYFYGSLEDLSFLLDAGSRDQTETNEAKRPTLAEWQRSYAILAAAYTRRIYTKRRLQLDTLRQGKPAAAGLEAMLRLALGERLMAPADMLEQVNKVWPPECDPKLRDAAKATLTGIGTALDEPGWLGLAEALELIWRRREGGAPVAQQVEWRGVYASEDATLLKAPNLDGTPRWHTFGRRRPAPAQDQPPEPLLGWAIASPLLSLGQGQRTVVLTLVFQPDSFDGAKIAKLLPKPAEPGLPVDPKLWPFLVESSGAEGWLAPTALTMEIGEYTSATPPLKRPTLRLTLGFDVSAPPLAALPDGASPWPMLRLRLRSVWQEGGFQGSGYLTPYPLLRALVLERVLIQAEVAGLTGLSLSNDDGPLTAGKPFEPFGLQPTVGSGFQFTHPELVIKRLARLDLNLVWMKVPGENLVAHYQNYPAIQADSVFTAKFSLMDRRQEIRLDQTAPLFDKGNATLAHKISVDDVPTRVQADRPGYLYEPEYGLSQPIEPSDWLRYWRLELNSPDFQHGNYTMVATAKAIQLTTSIASPAALGPANSDTKALELKPSAFQVNPPYTPKLKSFSVDYGAGVEIAMNPTKLEPPAHGYGVGEERIFHQHAFGLAEIQPEGDAGSYHLLPDYGYEGELYIGLDAVAAPQDVALLFQLAEGSANPDLPTQPVAWSYLSGDRWISLGEGGILADGSSGLTGTGIIKLRLPEAAPSGLLPSGQYWLRAAILRDAASVCDTIAIHTQAVAATWENRGNAPDHLSQPLPPQTIKKTADPVPGIQSISQPYTSFGGRLVERDDAFDGRVSERLRHKQRALTLWDYEHLILEYFPGIYKAKCIPAASEQPDDLGRVDVIVIPDIHNQLPFNPFAPRATAGQIAEITRFLEARMPPLADIRVRHAQFVPVRVRFAVRFMPGCDPGFHKALLNDELNRFLSPWAYRAGGEVVIGGSLYANAIVDFLERRAYVDYVAELKLFKCDDGLNFKLVTDKGDGTGYRVRAELPDQVLVADGHHEIDLITDSRFEESRFTGIDYMKIELDFIVN